MKLSYVVAVIVALLLLLAGLLSFWWLFKPHQLAHPEKNMPLTITNMKITSPAFEAQQKIPTKYTCDGEKLSPPLIISEPAANAESLVLIVDDPDAPQGTFTHWLVWNIPPTTSKISADTLPASAVQGQNDGQQTDYVAPCPPNGQHRYFFKLFALDQMLSLSEGAKRAELEAAMKGHVLAQTELIGTYERGTP